MVPHDPVPPAACYARLAGRLPLAALAILFGLLCLRVWDLGVTHTDDAMWLLRSHTSFFSTIDDWARWQGRLWAYVSGSLIMLALVGQGTLWGELLRLGSFALFFGAFHLVAAVYCGRRIALLCATLFLGLFALKWDGSLLTTYPMITWPAGIACAGALLAGRAWTGPDGKRWQLAAAGLLLFCALFNNEGVTVTFIMLALLSVGANAAQVDRAAHGRLAGLLPRRSAQLLAVFLATAAGYAALYVGWRLLHPSGYAGNALAPFDAHRILVTLVHFSTSGSALHELFAPLSMAYADKFGSGAWVRYPLDGDWQGLAASPLALLAGALTALLLWRLLRSGAAPAAAAARATPLRCALAGGLALALLPILPVALVGNYQDWAMGAMRVRAYSHTIFAHFGWSLVLAALLAALAGRLGRGRTGAALLLLLALAGGLLAALAYRANDAIALDMRPEAGRWAVANRAVAANQALFQSAVLWVPGLAQRSQYGRLTPRYWEQYVAARFGVKTEVAERIPDLNDLMHGVVMLDYEYDAAARRMVALMMRYRADAPGGPFQGGRIVVDLGAGAPADYLLEYRAGAALRRVPVAQLAATPGRSGRYLLDPPGAIDPASVRLLRADAGADGRALAAIRVPRGVRIDFRQPRMARPAFDPAAFLDAGWYPLASASVWSRGGEVHVRIPRRLLPAGPLRLVLDAASYTSMGFGPGLQQMAASVNGVPIGKWDYRPGANPDIALDLPAALPDGPLLDLRFDIGPAMNPKRLGLDPHDTRELGLQLRSVRLLPQGAAG